MRKSEVWQINWDECLVPSCRCFAQSLNRLWDVGSGPSRLTGNSLQILYLCCFSHSEFSWQATFVFFLSTVSDDEFKRLREAFKRYSTPAGYMSRPIFIKDVLGDSMPAKLGEVSC